MPQQKRDLWEMEDDTPPPWRVQIEQRARAVGNTIVVDARWQMFALQEMIDHLHALPASRTIRQFLLHGPLVNGITSASVRLTVVLMKGISPATQGMLWEMFSQLLRDGEQMYRVKFDCLLLTEEDLEQPATYEQIFDYEYVQLWSE